MFNQNQNVFIGIQVCIEHVILRFSSFHSIFSPSLFVVCPSILLIKLIGNRMPYLKIVFYSMQRGYVGKVNRRIRLDLYQSKLQMEAHAHQNGQ